MLRKPKILLTNDDGILAPGLKSLWTALSDYADVTIVAPVDDVSGSGAGITLKTPLRVDPVSWESGAAAWKVNGKPADCVKLGVSAILKETPDLIVSGINRGSNAGRTVFYSGTVGGVIEGALRQISGIAFSCEEMVDTNYKRVESYVRAISRYLIESSFSKGTIFNVNFPKCNKKIEGIKLARQGLGFWLSKPDERIHPTEKTPYFWLGGEWEDHEEADDSDVALLQNGFVTIVPMRIDQLTHHSILDQNRVDFENELRNYHLQE